VSYGSVVLFLFSVHIIQVFQTSCPDSRDPERPDLIFDKHHYKLFLEKANALKEHIHGLELKPHAYDELIAAFPFIRDVDQVHRIVCVYFKCCVLWSLLL
jgi:hypothetical protein